MLIFLLAFQLAAALGIRPARTTIVMDDYPNEEVKIDGKLWVVNSDHKEFAVDVYVEGEMAEFVKLKAPEKKMSFRADEEAKEVNFEIKFKKDKIPPGTTTASIVIEERIVGSSPNVISSKILLKHKINIIGSYPDHYIEESVNFHDKGDTIELVSEVKNLGQLDLYEVQTTFYVNDKEQQQHQVETDKKSLKRKETTLLTTTIAKDNFDSAGQYEVSAITKYDDQTLEMYKTLVIGKPDLDITYFDKYFIAYKVNQYTMDLLNKWNKQITNVYIDVQVLKEGKEVDSFRTKSVDIEGEMIKRVSDYLDAKDKGPGKYSFEMTVHFWGLVRMDEKKFTFSTELVTEADAKNLHLGAPALTGAATGYAIDGVGGMLPWLLVGILIGIIGFYVGWRYVNRDRYEEGNKPF